MRENRLQLVFAVGALLAGTVSGCSSCSSQSGKGLAANQPDMTPKELCQKDPEKDRERNARAQANFEATERAKQQDVESRTEAAQKAVTQEDEALCTAVASALDKGESLEGPLKAAGIKAPKEAFQVYWEARADCHAILANSDGECDKAPSGIKDDCKNVRSFFTEAKGAPANTAWRFTSAFMENCKKMVGGLLHSGDDTCNAVKAAVIASDPGRCPQSPAEAKGWCTALAGGDPSYCPEGAQGCARLANRYKIIGAGGLAALADKGADNDRIYAAAALGKPDACGAVGGMLKAWCIKERGTTHMSKPIIKPPPAGPPPPLPPGGKYVRGAAPPPASAGGPTGAMPGQPGGAPNTGVAPPAAPAAPAAPANP